MHRDCPDRIVDPEGLEDLADKDDNHATNQANQGSGPCRDGETIRGNGDKPTQCAIDELIHVKSLVDRISQTSGRNGTDASPDDRVDQDRWHGVIQHQGAATVEAKPADEEKKSAKRGGRHVRRGNGLRARAVIKAPQARADNQDERETRPAANAVNHRRPGKIHKPQIRKPARSFCYATGPTPVTCNGIEKPGHDQSGEEICTKLHTFGDNPRKDRDRCHTQHHLKQEEDSE